MSPLPKKINIKNGRLPSSPGVYFMKNAAGEIIYIGRATSLKTRISSYFRPQTNPKTAALVSDISSIDYQITDSVLESILLESELIKKHQPKYNLIAKDDKSWSYLVFTKTDFPKPVIIRARELQGLDQKSFLAVLGPFTSHRLITAVLSIIRKIFPFSDCLPNQGRPCFYYHLKQCPGVCLGLADKKAYRHNIKNIIRLFQGGKKKLLTDLKRQMKTASAKSDFELAAIIRNQLISLEHIRDTSLLKKEYLEQPFQTPSDCFARIEGYDISNISGVNSVGSMVVFADKSLRPSEYKKFKIKTVSGPNDTAMLVEIITRRFAHPEWAPPDIIMVDGGQPQVSATVKALHRLNINIPVLGIAKGPKRKNNIFILGFSDPKLISRVKANRQTFISLRDEAHRFAIKYHRHLRSKIK